MLAKFKLVNKFKLLITRVTVEESPSKIDKGVVPQEPAI
jgi:hypothetical protein